MEANWRWVLVTAVAPVAWGSNYYVTRQFLPLDYPLWGAVLRALPAGLILLALARTRPRGSWWWKSLVLGALNVGAFFVLVYVAAQLLPSSIASTIMATSAAVLLLLAWPLLSERPAAVSVAGALTGFTGVCVLLLNGGGVDPAGAGASLAAMLMSSLGYILTKRWAGGQSVMAVTAWQLIAGGVLVVPAAALVEGAPPQLTGSSLAAFCYVTLVATALAFVAWFTGLRHLPAATVGIIGLLNPLTGVLLGTLAAAEPFGPRQFAGAALVLAGVLIGRRASRPPQAGTVSGAGAGNPGHPVVGEVSGEVRFCRVDVEVAAGGSWRVRVRVPGRPDDQVRDVLGGGCFPRRPGVPGEHGGNLGRRGNGERALDVERAVVVDVHDLLGRSLGSAG